MGEMKERKRQEAEFSLNWKAFGSCGINLDLQRKIIPAKTKGEFAKFFGIPYHQLNFYTEQLVEFFSIVHPNIQWDDDTKDVWIQAGIGRIEGVKFLSLFTEAMKGCSAENPPDFGLVKILISILNRTKVLPIAKLYKETTGKCVCCNNRLVPNLKRLYPL